MAKAVKQALTDAEISSCFPVMAELRPELEASNFVTRVRRQMEHDRYHLLFVPGEAGPVAVAGYRILENLHMGRHLYVDDLVTLPSERGRGYAQLLLAWMEAEARRLECSSIHLDSGTQRHPAHRLYIKAGMDIVYYHFRKMLC